VSPGASADALPFPDASFDTVTCVVSLCNIPDDEAAITEMFRVLRPGGRLVLLDHVASDRHWVLAVERLLEPLTFRMNGDHLTRRPLPLVEAAGFSVIWSHRSKAGIIEQLTAVKPSADRNWQRAVEPPDGGDLADRVADA
jgi:SAM-dependent methyltransferase